MKKIYFSILVHEKKAVVKEMIHNIRYFCPNSHIILYNGGKDPSLCNGLGCLVCPRGKKVVWGQSLVWYYLDIMKWIEEQGCNYDYLVFVDSDALFAKKGFEKFIFSEMQAADYMAVALRQPTKKWYPGRMMQRVWRKWLPVLNTPSFLGCFNNGQVFSRTYVKRLVNSHKLQQIESNILKYNTFALEEILFPTLTKTFGLKAKRYPKDIETSIRWRPHFKRKEVEDMLKNDRQCFLFHPIKRNLNDEARVYIRNLKK